MRELKLRESLEEMEEEEVRDDGEGRRVAEEVKARGGGRGGRDAGADEVDDESEEWNESLCISDFFSFRHVAAAIVVVNERNLHQERERG